VFRFEEYWIEFDGFDDAVKQHWHHNSIYKIPAQDLTARFKSVRQGLKKWSRNLSKLN
jgi:hypothetical protein